MPADKTKHMIHCSGSGQFVYDEFHFSEEDLIRLAQDLIAEKYQIAEARVKVSPSNRTGMAVCLRVDLSPEVKSITYKGSRNEKN